jgi:multidrug resistance protein MdtO
MLNKRDGSIGAIDFLRNELAPKPGRLSDVIRITALTLIVLVIEETFRLPLPAYAAYIVFFASLEDKASTAFIGVVLIISHTVAIFTALGVYTLSIGEFGIRLPMMTLLTFVGVFFSRVCTVPPAAFVLGFISTMALTMIDVIPSLAPLPTAEIVTQTVLWYWLVGLMPLALVVAGNLLTGRDPAGLFRRSLAARLDATGRVLLVGHRPHPKLCARINELIRAGTTDLLRYLKMSGLLQKPSPRQSADDRALIARTHELVTLANEWAAIQPSGPSLRADAAACGTLLRSLARSINEGMTSQLQRPSLTLDQRSWQEDRPAALVLERLIDILTWLPELLAERADADLAAQEPQAAPPAKRQILIPDAFSNPDHQRFALKVTLCVISAYITYNLLDWPNIRTSVITCFFVTLGSAGETFHKMALRMIGALVGGGLGLATVVFVMPSLTDITDLCLVIGVVTFIAGWIARGSERLSYAGMQMAMAFFFCVLVGFGPTINLAMARDRLVGILLGNVLVWLVFSNIWPVSAGAQAKKALASAIGTLAQVFLVKDVGLGALPGRTDTVVFAFDNALARAWRLLSFHLFEPKAVKMQVDLPIDASDVEAVQSLFGPALLLDETTAHLPSGREAANLVEQAETYRMALGTWLRRLAEGMATGEGAPSEPPPDAAMVAAAFEAAGPRDAALLARAEWYRELDGRVRSVAELARTRGCYNTVQYEEAKA